jgi:hypothetical protein
VRCVPRQSDWRDWRAISRSGCRPRSAALVQQAGAHARARRQNVTSSADVASPASQQAPLARSLSPLRRRPTAAHHRGRPRTHPATSRRADADSSRLAPAGAAAPGSECHARCRPAATAASRSARCDAALSAGRPAAACAAESRTAATATTAAAAAGMDRRSCTTTRTGQRMSRQAETPLVWLVQVVLVC